MWRGEYRIGEMNIERKVTISGSVKIDVGLVLSDGQSAE